MLLQYNKIMSKLRLHIANANQTFTDAEIAIFKNTAQQAETFISSEFAQFDYEVDVIITTPSFMLPTIAEDGIAGKTLHSPSGKALGFGPSIRRFESCRPSQI